MMVVKVMVLLLSFLLSSFIGLAQDSILTNNQIVLEINTDSITLNKDGFLVIPLTIIKTGNNNILLYKKNSKNNLNMAINRNNSPLSYRCFYSKHPRTQPYKKPNRLERLSYYIKYGYRVGTRVRRVKVLNQTKLKAHVLEQDTNIILIALNYQKLLKTKHKGEILPTHIQFYYTLFSIDGWFGSNDDGMLYYNDYVSHAPYRVIRRVSRNLSNNEKLVLGRYKSNKVVVGVQAENKQ